MKIKKITYLIVSSLLIGLIISACSLNKTLEEEVVLNNTEQLKLLADYMSGRFTSQKQAEEDDSYHNISLVMKPIWKHRKDGFWLYVEQSLAVNPFKPYRQRVYQLVQYTETLFESRVFDILDADKFVGAWTTENPLSELTAADLILMPYCGVILRGKYGENPEFKGKTVGSSCRSGMYGAEYIESEVVITADRMISWDKGMNDNGEQVWGPHYGGYEFRKIENFSSEKKKE